jgi:hypothetical protein
MVDFLTSKEIEQLHCNLTECVDRRARMTNEEFSIFLIERVIHKVRVLENDIVLLREDMEGLRNWVVMYKEGRIPQDQYQPRSPMSPPLVECISTTEAEGEHE